MPRRRAPDCLRTSYHNHTRWSDGASTVAEHIEAARAAGLDEIGISDHFVIHPDGVQLDWSMDLRLLDDYVSQIREVAADTSRPTVRLGIEADYFPETIDRLRERLADVPFDFVIGSVHYVEGFPIDAHGSYWKSLSEDEANAKWRSYWERVRGLAESRVFDIMAHLDLPKKFAHRPTIDLTAEAHEALNAISEADMAIEINTSGWALPAAEAYPEIGLLRAARARNIPLVINADAHAAAHLTRYFGRALLLAKDAGYTEVVRFEGRKRRAAPLDC